MFIYFMPKAPNKSTTKVAVAEDPVLKPLSRDGLTKAAKLESLELPLIIQLLIFYCLFTFEAVKGRVHF